MHFDLDAYTSFLASGVAAEIFWLIFGTAVVVTLLLALIRPKTTTRIRMRTRIYEIPAPPTRTRPTRPAELLERREQLDRRLHS